MYDVVVIGGGASGLCAAINAAQNIHGGKVAIIEKNPRTGKKILTTGNGRCNLTNLDISIDKYHTNNSELVKSIFDIFGFEETKAFFNKIGVVFYNEGNKVFPNSLQAASVLDLLRFEAQQNKVQEICNFNCVSVEKKEYFHIQSNDGRKIVSKAVIFACGGKAAPQSGTNGSAYDILKTFGHKMTKVFPSLIQLVSDTKKVVPLKGVKINGEISIYADEKKLRVERGEILFTDYGLSGPPVFQLSRIASECACLKKDCYVSIDLLPDYTKEDVYELLIRRNKNLTLDVFTNGLFNKAVGREIIKNSTDYKLNLSADILSYDDYERITDTIKDWRFDISGTKGWDAAQVTAGGIKLDDFNSHTLESLLCDFLYACGEILDVDGDCGGYNLQWAWSSGAVAGKSAAEKINKGK